MRRQIAQCQFFLPFVTTPASHKNLQDKCNHTRSKNIKVSKRFHPLNIVVGLRNVLLSIKRSAYNARDKTYKRKYLSPILKQCPRRIQILNFDIVIIIRNNNTTEKFQTLFQSYTKKKHKSLITSDGIAKSTSRSKTTALKTTMRDGLICVEGEQNLCKQSCKQLIMKGKISRCTLMC